MATRAEYLVNETHDDVTRLVQTIDTAASIIWRITQRMVSIGGDVLNTHSFENGYSKANFVALYTALNELPDFVINDDARDKILLFLSSVQ
jgi:hypothetical protein